MRVGVDRCATMCTFFSEPELAEGIFAGKMLGQVLVTKQTGPEGKPVNKVIVYQLCLSIEHHMY